MGAAIERHIAIVCNPLAGDGRALAVAEKILKALSRKKIRHKFFRVNWPVDFSAFTDVFIAGGDGTLNFFINHYPDIKIPLAIFKGGSGNDFHWLLYGNKTFEEQLEAVLSAKPKRIDAGKCNEKLFINGVGVGFDGAVARSLRGKKKAEGKRTFLFAILKKIVLYRSDSYEISCDELSDRSRKLLIGVTNGKRAGGGFLITPEASANDKLFDVILVDALNPVRRLRYLPVIENGKHLGLPFVRYFKTKKICIASRRLMDAHLDGEYYRHDRFEMQILPAKFLFLY